MSDILYIIMPAYNEEETIADAVRAWYAALDAADPASRLVVDISGSTDGTEAILTELKKTFPKLRTLGGGITTHGPKLIRMYRAACRAGADYIFQTDSDGQTDASEFPDFWKDRKKYDAQLGKRTVRGDGMSRKIVEDILCLILRVIFGVKIPDANAPFRLMKADLVRRYIGRMPKDYNLPNVMLSVYFTYFSENVVFKEISFAPRQGGKNSLDLRKIFRIGIRALGDFLAFRRVMRLTASS